MLTESLVQVEVIGVVADTTAREYEVLADVISNLLLAPPGDEAVMARHHLPSPADRLPEMQSITQSLLHVRRSMRLTQLDLFTLSGCALCACTSTSSYYNPSGSVTIFQPSISTQYYNPVLQPLQEMFTVRKVCHCEVHLTVPYGIGNAQNRYISGRFVMRGIVTAQYPCMDPVTYMDVQW